MYDLTQLANIEADTLAALGAGTIEDRHAQVVAALVQQAREALECVREFVEIVVDRDAEYHHAGCSCRCCTAVRCAQALLAGEGGVMDINHTCATCKWWAHDPLGEYGELRVMCAGQCLKAESKAGYQRYSDTTAFAVSRSGDYTESALLLTLAAFGCIQWEQKEATNGA